MRMAYADLRLKLDFKSGEIKILQIENPAFAIELLDDLLHQINGEDGKVIFENENQLVNLSKEAELIINPFELDFSAHKIQMRLFKEAKEIGDDYCVEQMAEVRSKVVSCLSELEKHLPYPISYNDEFDLSVLLKMLSFSIDDEGEVFPDKLITYVKLLQRLCGIELFVFVNLLQFLSDAQIDNLQNELRLLDVYSLFLEVKVNHLAKNACVVDNDLCVIE